MVSVIIGNL